MRELVDEAHVRELETDAPGTGHGVIEIEVVAVRPPGKVAVTHEGSHPDVGAHGRHAFGTVLHAAIVAGTVPAEDARCAPVHLVFDKGFGQPALALAGAAAYVTVIVPGLHVKAAHALDPAVVHIKLDIPGVEGLDLDRKAGPEHASISFGRSAVIRDVEAAAPAHSIKIGRQSDSRSAVHEVGGSVIVEIVGVTALHAVHGPRGHGDTAVVDRQHEGEKVHVVQVAGVVVIVQVAVCTVCIVASRIVVVIGTEPHGGKADVLVEIHVRVYGSPAQIENG